MENIETKYTAVKQVPDKYFEDDENLKGEYLAIVGDLVQQMTIGEIKHFFNIKRVKENERNFINCETTLTTEITL